MCVDFDLQGGCIIFNGVSPIGKNDSPTDVERKGISFSRKISMKTGWCLIVGAPEVFEDRTFHKTFGFESDRLKWVQFGWSQSGISGAEAVRGSNDAFLIEKLGQPSVRDANSIGYLYGWGEVSSYADFKTGDANMWIKWI